jgi:regulator of replication initiation timing
MAKDPYADLPGHKKLDASIRDALSQLGSVERQLQQKLNSIPADQRGGFTSMIEDAKRLQLETRQLRAKLWETVA